MKSNVKAALGALAVACKSSSDTDGLVVVPMLETAPSASIATVDASVGSQVGRRPTVEPHAPQGQTCNRDVHCVEASATAAPWPFSPPYDKCDPAPLGEPGRFSPMETTSHRADDPNACCYVSYAACARRPTHSSGGRGNGRVMIGRPLRDERGEAIVGVIDDGGADALVRFWLEGAAAEHASVAEFARLSLVLMAHGAPAELLVETHRAALDEIGHAKTCLAIASALAGRNFDAPGPLDVSRAEGAASIAELARCTLRDGCVGETAAAIELAEMAREEPDADRALAIGAMAADEARHAALAWRILDFAIARDAGEAWRAIDGAALEAKTAIEARVIAETLSALATRRPPRGDDCAREA